MGPWSADAKSLCSSPVGRRLLRVSPDRGEGAMGFDVSGGDWPNGLTETAARRDDGTLHARFGDSYRIQLRSVRAGTRLAACWTLPRPLAGRDWALEQ